MEELAEGFLRTLFKILRWVLIEAFIEFICFYVGKYSLLLITLGSYPRKQDESAHETRIAIFGLLVLSVLFILSLFLLPPQN